MEERKCATGSTSSLCLFEWNALALASLQNRDAPSGIGNIIKMID
jgi:hypothetical protein